MPKIDTLYDDIHDEMQDYVDMISWFNNHLMAHELAENDLVDDEEQQLSGLYCLFGIELHLTAAGVPSSSKKCPIRKHFLPYNSFRFNPDLVEPFRERIKQIAELRIAAGFPEKEIKAAANAMIDRLEKAVMVSANLPDLPIGPPPAPLKQISSMIGFGHSEPVELLNNKVPPWWNELLLRCRDVCEECVDASKLRSKLRGRIDEYRLGQVDFSHYIINTTNYPLLVPLMVDWLAEEIARTEPCFPSLLYCVIETSIFNATNLPERRISGVSSDHFFYLAYRVMLELAAKQPPEGLRQYLPSSEVAGIGIFKVPPTGSHMYTNTKYREFLLACWTGIRRKDYPINEPDFPAHPAELWPEICDLILLKKILGYISTTNDEELHVMHAWSAWCAGQWNADTIRALFPVPLIQWYSKRPLKPSNYHYRDDRFTEFCNDVNNVFADSIDRFVDAADMASLRSMFQNHRGMIRLETLLCIAENLKPKESLSLYSNLLNVNTLPEGAALKKCIKRLKALPQETLRRFAICSGMAYPYFLDAIDDPQCRHLLEILIDTFSEPLVIDPENLQMPALKPNPNYPGRTPSGVTNLNPLYAAIASCPVELWNRVIEEADISKMIRISKQFLRSMVNHSEETDAELDDGDEDIYVLNFLEFFDFAAVARLTHRIPAAAADWEKERQTRLDGLAELMDAKDSYWPDTIVTNAIQTVCLACRLYAESRGINSWQEAALEMADCLLFPQPVACGTYTIQQDVSQLRGTVVFKGKAKEPLKSIPPALQKEEKSALILHRCRLFHLLYRTLRKDFVDTWIETGDRPGKKCSTSFEHIFQKSVLPMLNAQSKPTPPASEIQSLMCKLVPVVLAHQNHESQNVDRDPHKESIILERIQHFDWTFDFSPKSGMHKLQRNFTNQQLSFCFMPIKEEEQTLKIDKKKPLDMELRYIEIERKSSLRADDPRVDRIITCLAYEIGLSREGSRT
jgi:hypothetical protein